MNLTFHGDRTSKEVAGEKKKNGLNKGGAVTQYDCQP